LLVTGLYFVAGLALLAGVDAARGRRSALRGERLPHSSTPEPAGTEPG